MYTKQLAECLSHNKAQTKKGKEKNLYLFFLPKCLPSSVFSIPFYAPWFPFSMIFLPPEGPPLKSFSNHLCL